MADFDTCISFAKQAIGFGHTLKDKQLQSLKKLYNGNDVISVLPTGYGKSIIFQLLPWFFQRQHNLPLPGIVIVICPLNSIIQDQVISLRSKGIPACYLSGSSAKTFEREECASDEESEVDNDLTMTDTDFEDLAKGRYNIIYSHPESILNKKFYRLLRTKLYKDRVCCVVVDEVHMIAEWGEEFRPMFKKLGDLTCLFDSSPHLAVTATASPSSILDLAKTLQYQDHATVTMNPDRSNIYIEVKPRLPNSRKTDKFDELIDPLSCELKSKLLAFPVTIVYVENLEALGYYYQYLNSTLGELQYAPISNKIPEGRIFAQYHTEYTADMKTHILRELQKDNPHIRLVVATVALGMGLDSPSITRVIHCRPPTSLEKYLQEIGRAGRAGQKATAIMYHNKSDIAKNRTGMTAEMVKFCNNVDSCLRLQLVKYFGFQTTTFEGPMDECCSNCRQSLLSAVESVNI
ncbi:ATP-dependent DNA helicase Q1-like [Argopecten irradians]|uniref:ATP-dependent DNA helicase Q1-like n=1 Tax=Argopecten irradians TaxID=31199 RepID=UPI00371A5CCA